MFRIYKPQRWIFIADIIAILANVLFVLVFLPITTRDPFGKYSIPTLLYILVWIFFSYVFKRYDQKRKSTFFIEIFKLLYTTLLTMGIFSLFILIQSHSPYSENILFFVSFLVFIALYFVYFTYYSFKYAVGYDAPILNFDRREQIQHPTEKPLAEDAKEERRRRITECGNERLLDFLNKNINVYDKSTLLLTNLRIEQFSQTKPFDYQTIALLQKLNTTRGINKFFALSNELLPDNGLLLCCYRSKSSIKQNLLKKHSKTWAYTRYIIHYMYHRMLPKFFLTRRIYYDITNGKKRVLSKTEILGRLSYCGFSIKKQVKINGLNYIIAERVRNSEPLVIKNYAALIKLRRTGKNGKMFNVYKFRTMHPYAEYIQQYIFETASLAKGGKFRKDIRVTTLGRWMRRYWIDELPMFINLFKGEMKLIGVRPLSRQYFNLYKKEVQEKRTKVKPGLLPPFYADMPKTLDEIQASEMKYLIECEAKGAFVTDTKYLFLILRNILFKKARSA